MPRYEVINGIRRQLSAAEEAECDARDLAWTNGAFDRAMEDLRAKRNALLQETDWTANSDVTMSSEMTTYRQQLRDLTNGLTTVADVGAVVFPTKP
jgi:hypothetical protein